MAGFGGRGVGAAVVVGSESVGSVASWGLLAL